MSFFTIPNIVELIAIIILSFGFVIVFISFIYLGESNSFGLSTGNPSLKIKGIYKFSRNPMYFGFYLLVISSILFTLNPVILLLGIYSILIHHKIILSEEKFLQQLFGKEYNNYCKKVRRYF